MINKNRQTDSKTDKQSWIDVFARTQKLKSSGDESWKKDVPNIKLSRAFIVVLILHVVAVGGNKSHSLPRRVLTRLADWET